MLIKVDNIQNIITVLIFKKKNPLGIETHDQTLTILCNSQLCLSSRLHNTMLKVVVNFTAYFF